MILLISNICSLSAYGLKTTWPEMQRSQRMKSPGPTHEVMVRHGLPSPYVDTIFELCFQ